MATKSKPITLQRQGQNLTGLGVNLLKTFKCLISLFKSQLSDTGPSWTCCILIWRTHNVFGHLFGLLSQSSMSFFSPIMFTYHLEIEHYMVSNKQNI